MKLTPKSWERFQHYKKRRPPWIKLHRELLDDSTFMRLPIASKALAPLLWLLAAESETGEFVGTLQELSFRLRLPEETIEEGLRPLLETGMFYDASNALAPASNLHQNPSQRQSKAELRQTRVKTDPPTPRKKRGKQPTVARIEGVPEETWNDWLAVRKQKRQPLTDTALKAMEREAKKCGMTLADAIIFCAERPWGGFTERYYRSWQESNGSKTTAPRRTARDRDRGTMLDPDALIEDHPIVSDL